METADFLCKPLSKRLHIQCMQLILYYNIRLVYKVFAVLGGEKKYMDEILQIIHEITIVLIEIVAFWLVIRHLYKIATHN